MNFSSALLWKTWYTDYLFGALPHCRVSGTLLKGPTTLRESKLTSQLRPRPNPITATRSPFYQNPVRDLKQLDRRSRYRLLAPFLPSILGHEERVPLPTAFQFCNCFAVISTASALLCLGCQPSDCIFRMSRIIFVTSPFQPLPPSMPPVNLYRGVRPITLETMAATCLTSIWSFDPTL